MCNLYLQMMIIFGVLKRFCSWIANGLGFAFRKQDRFWTWILVIVCCKRIYKPSTILLYTHKSCAYVVRLWWKNHMTTFHFSLSPLSQWLVCTLCFQKHKTSILGYYAIFCQNKHIWGVLRRAHWWRTAQTTHL